MIFRKLILLIIVFILFIINPTHVYGYASHETNDYKEVVEKSNQIIIGFATGQGKSYINENNKVITKWDIMTHFVLKGDLPLKKIQVYSKGGEHKGYVQPGVKIDSTGRPYILFLGQDDKGWYPIGNELGVRPVTMIKINSITDIINIEIIDKPLLKPLEEYLKEKNSSYKIKLKGENEK